jgi:transposase
MKLTEEQWSILKPLIPTPKIRKDGRGRPWRGNREVLEGILWVLRNGCSWSSLPAEYPPYQTCHRRFQQWQKQGVWDKLLKSIARVTSASPHESKLAEETFNKKSISRNPKRLIADKAYDSKKLRRAFSKKRVDFIVPQKSNAKEKIQDGRKLRRYKKRWKVERFFSWLHSFKRTWTRYEIKSENFLAMVQLASTMILIRHL